MVRAFLFLAKKATHCNPKDFIDLPKLKHGLENMRSETPDIDAIRDLVLADQKLVKEFERGIAAKNRGDAKKAVAIFTEVVDQGLAAAQTELGICYLQGIGVSKDLELARHLFNEAAIQEYDYAKVLQAWCFLKGVGGKESPYLAELSLGDVAGLSDTIPRYYTSHIPKILIDAYLDIADYFAAEKNLAKFNKIAFLADLHAGSPQQRDSIRDKIKAIREKNFEVGEKEQPVKITKK